MTAPINVSYSLGLQGVDSILAMRPQNIAPSSYRQRTHWHLCCDWSWTGGMVNGCHVLLCVRHDITGMRARESPLIILELIARSRPNTSWSRYHQSFRRSNCTCQRKCTSEKTILKWGIALLPTVVIWSNMKRSVTRPDRKYEPEGRADGHFCAAGAEILYFGARSQRICEEKSSKWDWNLKKIRRWRGYISDKNLHLRLPITKKVF